MTWAQQLNGNLVNPGGSTSLDANYRRFGNCGAALELVSDLIHEDFGKDLYLLIHLALSKGVTMEMKGIGRQDRTGPVWPYLLEASGRKAPFLARTARTSRKPARSDKPSPRF